MTNASKTYHSRLSRIVSILAWVACIGTLAAHYSQGGLTNVVGVLAPTLLVVFLGWLVLWAPSVSVSDAGLVIRNPFRSCDIHWSAVQDVLVSYALSVSTTGGKVTAWAAPAASNGAASRGRMGAFNRMAADSGDVAAIILGRWARLNRTESVPRRVPGESGFDRQWSLWRFAVLAALIAVNLAAVVVLK